MDAEDPDVGTGMVGAPACGDVMRLQIKVNEQGIIEDAKFKTYGCGSAIASSSLATEWMKGKTLDEAETIKNTQLAEELALPPVKIHPLGSQGAGSDCRTATIGLELGKIGRASCRERV